MRKFISEYIGGFKAYAKSNKTIIRMIEEPGCTLRAHFIENEFARRIILSRCRCLGHKKKYFEDKKYLLADRVSQN